MFLSYIYEFILEIYKLSFFIFFPMWPKHFVILTCAGLKGILGLIHWIKKDHPQQ